MCIVKDYSFIFEVRYLPDFRSCELKNFDGPTWFLQDMSIGPTAYRKDCKKSIALENIVRILR